MSQPPSQTPVDPAPETTPPAKPRMQIWAERVFTADVRSLAATRIGGALVVLFDLWNRLPDLEATLTDDGLVPRHVLIRMREPLEVWSFHVLGGSAWFAYTLFAIAAAFAVLLLVGRWTRVATIVSFAMLVSMQARNPVVMYGGDWVLKMLLFWGIFLPWGAAWSLDARRRRSKGLPPAAPREVCTSGTAAAMLQVGFLYFFTAYLKSGSEWVGEFSALYYALSLDGFRAYLGHWIHPYPRLLEGLTIVAIASEWMAAFALFLPLKTRILRWIGVLAIVGLHVNILLTLHVNWFPWINLASVLIFLPGGFWDRLGLRLDPARDAIPATRPRPGGLVAMLPVLLIGYTLAFNFGLPKLLQIPGKLLKIDQAWGMFAPAVAKTVIWPVIAGTTVDGRTIDLVRGGEPVDWEKPDDVYAVHGPPRWRKYWRKLYTREYERAREEVAPYHCRQWNRRHEGDDRVTHVEFNLMVMWNRSDYVQHGPKRVSFGTADCRAVPGGMGD